MLKCIAVQLLFLCTAAFSIGVQHGVFRCQATQGTPWIGLSEIVNEKYRITVFPNYLDVELEWELNATGDQPPDSFLDAIEIVGNINLQQGSVVIGMLLWNGDDILEAKLKPVSVAREQYEVVVDRNAEVPPRPRDPVILEYRGNDNYDLSVFPVKYGESRRMRIRYLVPSETIGGQVSMGFPSPFTSSAQIRLIKDSCVDSFMIAGLNKMVTAGETPLSAAGLMYRSEIRIQPVSEKGGAGSVMFTGSFERPALAGSMAHVIAASPVAIAARIPFEEDYVILWRWNHPRVLEKYGHQIVEQSKVLQIFLHTLESGSKRAALIIDIEGKQRITFPLDSKYSDNYVKMMSYLESVLAMSSEEEPLAPGSLSQDQQETMAAKAAYDFEQAILHALSLFESSGSRAKRLILVTAGPHWVNGHYVARAIQDMGTVGVATLGDILPALYTRNGYTDFACQLYWPGIDVASFVAANRLDLTLTAAVTNGTDTVKTAANGVDREWEGARSPSYFWDFMRTLPRNEFKLHSLKPIEPNIVWSLKQGITPLATYVEKCAVVHINDAVQMARMYSRLGQLRSLDASLASTLAPVLGYVNENYALLALEEDRMSDTEAQHYVMSGVPDLEEDDIFASETPESKVFTFEGEMAAMSTNDLSSRDIEKSFNVRLVMGKLIIDLDHRAIASGEPIHLAIYTLSGRMVHQRTLSELDRHGSIVWSPSSRVSKGIVYIIQLRIGAQMFSKQVCL